MSHKANVNYDGHGQENKIIRNNKNTYMKNVIDPIEEDQKHNNTRKSIKQ